MAGGDGGGGEVIEAVTMGEGDTLGVIVMFTGLVSVAADALSACSCQVMEAVIACLATLAKAVLTMALSGGEGVHAGVWAGAVHERALQQVHGYRGERGSVGSGLRSNQSCGC